MISCSSDPINPGLFHKNDVQTRDRVHFLEAAPL